MLKFVCIIVALTFSALPALAKDYVITVGDRLVINILDESNQTVEALVRPDGKITVPNCGEVLARGLTPDQLKESIVTKLREIIRNPEVSVTVTQFVNSRVFVLGGGVKSTSFDLSQQASLLHLLASIEDMSSADLHNATLVRDGKEIKRDLYALYWGDASQDVPLKTGDTIVIPASAANRGVYVVGAVTTPKMVPYREGMTVLEALLEAGGFSKFASPNQTKVVRKENGQNTTIEVKGKRLVRDGDLSQNIVLKGGDLVIVEEGFF
jgi:polysaccharide export outer membrane protein